MWSYIIFFGAFAMSQNTNARSDSSKSTEKQSTSKIIENPRVFISHRSQDDELADQLRNALLFLGDNNLEVAVDQEIQGGANWRSWIETELRKAQVLVFIYTDDDEGWKWCLYEIGIFRGVHGANAHILCIKGPDIEKGPAPLTDLQWYNGDKSDCEELIKNLIYDEAIFGRKLNENLYSDNRFRDLLDDYTKKIAGEFTPLVRTEYLAPRLSIVVSKSEPDPKSETGQRINALQLEDAELDGQDAINTLRFADGRYLWSDLYSAYEETGQEQWLNLLSAIIEQNRRSRPGIKTLMPLVQFETSAGRTFLPIVTRFEYFRSRKRNPAEPRDADILRKIFITLVEDTVDDSSFHDLRDVFDDKNISIYAPCAVIQIRWSKMSGDGVYLPTDMVGLPVACRCNSEFANIFDFMLGGENGHTSHSRLLDFEFLFKRLQNHVNDDHWTKFAADQERLQEQIIYGARSETAKIPIQLGADHPKCPGKTYLPHVVAKETVGDRAGAHKTLIFVCYIEDFWPIDHPDNPFRPVKGDSHGT